MSLNPLLALSSMVINPVYYSHPEHKYHQQFQWLQSASLQYLSRVEEELTGNHLQKSLQAHVTTRLTNQATLQVDNKKIVGFHYLLDQSIEWALEFGRLIEKYLKVNSQGFTVQKDFRNNFHFFGFDPIPSLNFTWNPRLDALNQDIRQFCYKRQRNFRQKNAEVREAITMSLSSM